MKTLFVILCLATTLTARAAVPVDVLTDLASPDLARRYSAQMSLRNLVFEAGKPGASAEGAAAMEKELLDLAAIWTLSFEEMYLFKNHNREQVRSIWFMRHHPNNPEEKGFFPVAWVRQFGGGTVIEWPSTFEKLISVSNLETLFSPSFPISNMPPHLREPAWTASSPL